MSLSEASGRLPKTDMPLLWPILIRDANRDPNFLGSQFFPIPNLGIGQNCHWFLGFDLELGSTFPDFGTKMCRIALFHAYN